jgi:electron transport complex protein RnfD
MVGYVILLISFPVEMTRWATPQLLLGDAQSLPSLISALEAVFLGNSIGIDGYTGATPLDLFKAQQGLLVEQINAAQPLFSQASFAGVGWEWVNVAFLAGGAFLLYKRAFTWHAPISMLLALSLMALLFYGGGNSESGGSLMLHLFSGGTMLGAFFIITDPVSSAVSNRGRIIYGAGIGILIYIIRVWGNYPDAVAFAVLLMNFAAPFIDYYTIPRTYGHTKPGRATRGRDS